MMPALARSTMNRLLYAWQRTPPQAGVCRVLHDRECGRRRGNGPYPYLSRFYDPRLKQPRSLPETVRFYGGRSTVKLAQVWQDFFFQHNRKSVQHYLMRLDSGWVNSGPWPKVEQLCTASPAGTFVVVTRVEGGRAYIMSYDNGKTPADYAESDIDFLQLFGAAGTDDTISYPDVGLCYTFAIHNPGEELWMDVRDLTFVRPFIGTAHG